jgi:PhzF family phenazine biosynthesis protein
MNHATRAFTQVDVFTDTPLLGNALAVVLEAEGLSDAQMQALAQWTNLSETAFVLPPTEAGADYRVRIFTPGGELPFAGHPTLGSCHAWLEAGGQPRDPEFIVQQCAVGLVRIRREGSRLAFAAPTCRRSPIAPDLLAQISDALGLQAGQLRASQSLDNGPVWLSLLLDAPETVLALQPDHGRLRELGVKVGVAAAYRPAGPALIARANREARASRSETAPASPEPDLEVRAFAAASGILEDPVTGSLNASLGQWLMAEGLMPSSYLASQGSCLGRAGQVHVRRDTQGQVWVGGSSVSCIHGQLAL